MATILLILKIAAVLAVGTVLTGTVIPWLYVNIMRRLGFKAELTPVMQKRLTRFRRIKRGYWAFRVITTLFVCSLFLEVLVNSKPLMIHFPGKTAFPAVAQLVDRAVFFVDIPTFQKASDFGQASLGERPVDYRLFERCANDPAAMRTDFEQRRAALAAERLAAEAEAPAIDAADYYVVKHQRRLEDIELAAAVLAADEPAIAAFERGDAWMVMPLYPYGPEDTRVGEFGTALQSPSIAAGVPLGTDESGRDVVPQLLYGFRLSLAFALLVAFLGQSVGIVVGGMQGYFGGWVDIGSQRFVEIWGSIPFLFVMMIMASMITPTFMVLVIMLIVLRSWLGITWYVRGEFYREKAKDYVQAAIGAGVSDAKIILKHILPNAIVPIVTFAPFAIVGYVGALVSLDYLGFGLASGTPSWGGLLRQGLDNLKFYPHLTIVPTLALASTLYAVVMVGEAVREAFDPKVFSRLR